MKYSEAKKAIESLSSKYDVKMDDGDFNVAYNRKKYAIYVSGYYEYGLHVEDNITFSKFPFINKIYMILAELAATPLDEREEEKKYYVKAFQSYLNIRIIDNRPSINTSYENYAIHTKFTLKEIEQLKQRNDIPLDWNKVKLEEAE